MTNKSLSQQICEVCGIKPYYGVYVNFGDLDNNYKLVTNKRKYRLIADCRYIVDNEDELKNLEPKYLPDFENNNDNKIKLLEIISKYSPALVFLHSVFPIENAIKFCLNTLNDTRYTYYARKKLNQAIKNEQWEV